MYCTVSLQWRLMDCWIEGAASVWRAEIATAGVRSQCTHSWCDVLFPATSSSLPDLHAVKMQYTAAFISARSKDYGSMWGYQLCMSRAPPPLISLFILTWGTHPQSIAQAHTHSECTNIQISATRWRFFYLWKVRLRQLLIHSHRPFMLNPNSHFNSCTVFMM